MLQEMEVVDATVTPEKMQSVATNAPALLASLLRSYFNQRPAYVLRVRTVVRRSVSEETRERH